METGFGWIVLNGGARYEHDVVIHTDRSVKKRQKKLSKGLKGTYGHTPLSHEELGFLAREKPAVVYVGTGQYGDLPLTPEAKTALGAYETHIRTTPEILRDIVAETRPFVAILHVTC